MKKIWINRRIYQGLKRGQLGQVVFGCKEVKMIKKIQCRLRKTDTIAIFHDSRKDVQRLATTCSVLIDKVNELVDEVNRLNNIIKSKE